MPSRKLLKLIGTPESLATAWVLIVDLHSEFIDFCAFFISRFSSAGCYERHLSKLNVLYIYNSFLTSQLESAFFSTFEIFFRISGDNCKGLISTWSWNYRNYSGQKSRKTRDFEKKLNKILKTTFWKNNLNY